MAGIDMRPLNEDKPISEIPFARESKTPDVDQQLVRDYLGIAGANIGSDIGDFGCTGLILNLKNKGVVDYLTWAKFVRSHMDGSGLGLPCYVPPSQFCLVHNTIGGLQKDQEGRHLEGLQLCTRELTSEERAHVEGISAAVEQAGLEEMKKRFGAEKAETESETSTISIPSPVSGMEYIWVFNDSFQCPEHKQPVWKCRYCLASAIIHGPFEPDVRVRTEVPGEFFDHPIDKLTEMLELKSAEEVSIYVRVAHWARRLIKDE